MYAGLAVVVSLFVGALALTSRQSPPPTIAEFAPQAVEQITDASSDGTGTAAGVSGPESAEEETGAASHSRQDAVDVARVRRCVGDPPRQIEDPQSPPCVPHWEGDNGGATARGVSRDEIRIAAPPGFMNAAMERFFNSRFEFYGRKIRLIDTASDFTDCSAAGQEKTAVAADEQRNVFASMSLEEPCSSPVYDLALARRGIISIQVLQHHTEQAMRAHSPYMWSYPMAMDPTQVMFGDWACTRLAGRQARYAKGPEALNRRVFGIFAQMHPGGGTRIDTTPLQHRLGSCGERSAATFEFSSEDDVQMDANVVLQMREHGVTTIFCLCHVGRWGRVGAAATSNGYFPEWLVGTYYHNDKDDFVRVLVSPEQRAQAMGLSFLPRRWRSENNAAYWAQEEGEPGSGSTDRDSTWGGFWDWRVAFPYRSLLLLSSGIQMAGPHLTPQSFEAGLHRTVFPNPDHPIKPGKVGFLNGDHSMTDDVAEYWWSNSDRGPQSDDAGAVCYLHQGNRRRVGSFPTGDEMFFKLPCDSGA